MHLYQEVLELPERHVLPIVGIHAGLDLNEIDFREAIAEALQDVQVVALGVDLQKRDMLYAVLGAKRCPGRNRDLHGAGGVGGILDDPVAS